MNNVKILLAGRIFENLADVHKEQVLQLMQKLINERQTPPGERKE